MTKKEKNDKGNNDLSKPTTQKAKDWATETPLKPGVNASERISNVCPIDTHFIYK
jgi:hypothetical protein